MLTKINITGFKSFHEFEMTFTPLTIVAGTNASGKSNLFDALQLLSRLAETDLKTAFSEQRGNPNELFTQYDNSNYASEMSFTVEMLVNRIIKDNWGGNTTLNNTRLRYKLIISKKHNSLGIDDLIIKHESLEKIKYDNDPLVKTVLPKTSKTLWKTQKAGGSNDPFIQTEDKNGTTTIKLRQDGRQGGKATPANAVSQTVLGGITSIDFPHAFAAKEEMRGWNFLQLNPEDLREPTHQDIGLRDTITPSGKNLAAALFRITKHDQYNLKEISRKLNNFLPNFTEVKVYDDSANKQFIIKAKEVDGKEYSSRVLSEGTLRLLALCIIQCDDEHKGLLCFEEPENGIHPFRVKAMAQLLKDLSIDFTKPDSQLRQVIVNTHSPVLLNQMIQWHNDINVSVWFSQQHSLITDIGKNRIKLKISRMLPVCITPQQTTLFHLSASDRKLILSEAIQYLESADSETARKIIQ